MATNLPTSPPVKTNVVDLKVRRIRVDQTLDSSQSTLQRYLDSAADSLDGVLSWLNKTFAQPPSVVTPPGTVPSSASLPLVAKGALSAPNNSFKAIVGGWSYYTASYPGGIVPACMTYAGQTIESSQYGFVAPFPGSIVAINGRMSQSATAGFQPYLYQNNVPTQLSNTSPAINSFLPWGQTYPKGALPFKANDVLGLGVGWGTAGLVARFIGWLTVEMAP